MDANVPLLCATLKISPFLSLKQTFVRFPVFFFDAEKDDIPDSWCGSPNTESLKDAQTRAWMFWRERVVPSVKDGKTVLICAHGNIIRAMLKRLDLSLIHI